MEISQPGCFDAARFINAKPCWRQDHGPAAAWTAIAKLERAAHAMTCGWAIRIAVGRWQRLTV